MANQRGGKAKAAHDRPPDPVVEAVAMISLGLTLLAIGLVVLNGSQGPSPPPRR